MAGELKAFFSPALVRRMANEIAAVHRAFPKDAFVRDATRGLERHELKGRAQHIASALKQHLPQDYPRALDVLVRSLGPEFESEETLGHGMAPFFYLPHTMFVAEHGLEHFELSMKAQHELTRRCSCEFSVRAYLERWPDETLAVLKRWTRDPNAHVRRLVSEGTRPRLPWALRVSWIESQPERVLPLLEALKDDRASTVRRSVANHLNDLSKKHTALAFEIAERWLDGASDERRELVEHALRSAAKRGEPRALALLGFGARAEVEVVNSSFTPARVAIGGSTRARVEVRDTRKARAKGAQKLSAELVVHFVKANGKSSAKVFQLAQLSLAPGEQSVLEKTISLAVHTTRKPYPGRHAVDVRFNGASTALGAFVVTRA